VAQRLQVVMVMGSVPDKSGNGDIFVSCATLTATGSRPLVVAGTAAFVWS